jgi:hypothetical protein
MLGQILELPIQFCVIAPQRKTLPAFPSADVCSSPHSTPTPSDLPPRSAVPPFSFYIKIQNLYTIMLQNRMTFIVNWFFRHFHKICSLYCWMVTSGGAVSSLRRPFGDTQGVQKCWEAVSWYLLDTRLFVYLTILFQVHVLYSVKLDARRSWMVIVCGFGRMRPWTVFAMHFLSQWSALNAHVRVTGSQGTSWTQVPSSVLLFAVKRNP